RSESIFHSGWRRRYVVIEQSLIIPRGTSSTARNIVAGMDVDRLLRMNARSMLQLADFVLDNPGAAEEAVQQAFVAAWRQRKVVSDETAFRPWLRRMVLRECLGWQLHPMFRLLALTDRVVVQSASTAESGVAAALKHLSPSVRATVFLHLYDGLSIAQVASELRAPQSTVQARLRGLPGL